MTGRAIVYTQDTHCSECGHSFPAVTFGDQCPYCESFSTDVLFFIPASVAEERSRRDSREPPRQP